MRRKFLPRDATGRAGAQRVALAMLAAALLACDSQSVFEGEPVIAPPVTEFDRSASATRAIHGGVLPISVTASDRFVGVDSVMVRYTGALTGSFTRRLAGAPAQVRIDTVLAVPFGTQGTVVFDAFAMNRYGSTAQADTLSVQIVREDTIRPVAASQQIDVPARVELGDTVRVRTHARDDPFGSGIVTVGVIVRDAAAAAAPAVTFTHDVAPMDSVQHDFRIPVAQLPGPMTARTRELTFVSFAVDQAGNCTAVGAAGVPVPCTVAAGQVSVENVSGATASTVVTATRTFRQAAPSAARIGDMVVDPGRRTLYISNQANNSVDAFSWGTAALARTGRALVGAAPRGMSIENGGQRLIVANSGGTSLSYVGLGDGAFREITRYETPNAALWQISGQVTVDTLVIDGVIVEQARVEEVLEFTDFNDRPQFVGQDATGAVFYSTPGAVRWVEMADGWQLPESGIILWPQVVLDNTWGPGVAPLPCYDRVTLLNAASCVIAGVDSIKVVEHAQSPFRGTMWEFWAHPVGNPQASFSERGTSLWDIERRLRLRGARPFMYSGSWDYSFWQTGSNMFVTSSGNREWVSFVDADAGRVWNWGAIEGPSQIGGPGPRLYDRMISQFVNINDYEQNTQSPITAVATNHDGSAFVSRSGTSLFFFNNPLRLLGSYNGADIAGGHGVAIHPVARLGAAGGGDTYGDWAAAGSSTPEIVLIETRHFRRVGTVPLLEPVGGPLRVIQRLDTDPTDVIAHIFGVTQSGAVFHVPVRTGNFTP
jgi:DNA-binding beta-propeller fold protein YncE